METLPQAVRNTQRPGRFVGRRFTCDAAPEFVTSTLTEALRLAGLGFPLVAMHEVVNGVCSYIRGKECERAGNHPRTAHGVKDATTDETTIRRWFTQWPTA
jgi:hypothetical protein